MTRQRTARSSLETLRKEAKRWLKALRARDPKALERLRRSHPGAPLQPGLRDVQHALAREHGVENWAALKVAVAETALDSRTHEELLSEFLEYARLRYGIRPGSNKWDEQYYDDPSRWKYAARILQRHPEIVRNNIHAASVSGDLAEVVRILEANPAAATQQAVLDAQQPIDYVCYGRLQSVATNENAVAVATALLHAGAPCQHPLPDDDRAHFQPLTGAIGAGEAGQPPHPHAAALAALLIDRGADPYDAQALYNTALGDDDLFWLDFLYSRSAQRDETRKWTESSVRWPGCPMVDFLLIMAVNRNHPKRVQWALERGANPRCRHPYYATRNLHTGALVNGYTEIADLLLQFGGLADTLEGFPAFQVACVRLDRDAAAKLVDSHPEYLLNPKPLLLAASRDLKEVAELLLELGMSPDVADTTHFRPLHAAAGHDSVRVGTLLIERGAQIDPRETRFNGTPLSWAIHRNQRRMMDILGAMSRNVCALCSMGNVARLRELFTENPGLAKTTDQPVSPFFTLPDDESRAFEIAELLLANGADPRVVRADGKTPAEQAREQGLDAVADLLSTAVEARHR